MYSTQVLACCNRQDAKLAKKEGKSVGFHRQQIGKATGRGKLKSWKQLNRRQIDERS